MNIDNECKTNSLTALLPPHLFWDIEVAAFDAEKHSAQIVQRVLEYGELRDWQVVRDYYTLDRVESDCTNLRTLHPQALSFICAIHTPKEDYRCYHFRQSVTTLWNQQPATANRRPANRKGFIGDRFMRAG